MPQIEEELTDLIDGRGAYASKFRSDGIRLFLEGHIVVPRAEPVDGEIIEEDTPNGITVKAGSGPESVYEFIHVNPNWLRHKAVNLLNVADYIENRGAILAAKEAEARTARHARRDALRLQFGGAPFSELTIVAQNAINHIIEMEDAAK